jgi:hypothetical protein
MTCREECLNMAEETISCVEPAGEEPVEQSGEQAQAVIKEVKMDVARVGGKAPDFQAMAYHQGEFKQVKLSDYAGKWTMVCFYPGDFTFV